MVGNGRGREKGEAQGKDWRGKDGEGFDENVCDGLRVQEVWVELVSD